MTAILTFFLVSITTTYVIITRQMLNESRKQSEIINRPYIGIDEPNITTKKFNKLSFRFDLVNTGRTPANNVKAILSYNFDETSKFYTEDFPDRKIFGLENSNESEDTLPLFGFNIEPSVIFPDQLVEVGFNVESKYTLEYLVKNFKGITILLSIEYSGMSGTSFEHPYLSTIAFRYDLSNNKWTTERGFAW